jgi:hypothetical protein
MIRIKNRSLILAVVVMLALISPLSTYAAIAFDTAVDSGTRNGGTSNSWSHTVTGSNPILLVTLIYDNGSGINSVTYGGQAMTLADTSSAKSGRNIAVYYLINPPTGSNTVSVSYSGFNSNRLSQSASYTGVGSVDVVTKQANITTGTMTNTLTTLVANAWTVLGAVDYGDNGGTGTQHLTAGSGSTQRVFQTNIGDMYGVAMFDSNGPKMTPGSTSMTVTGNTVGSNFGLGGVMVSLAPYVAPAVIPSLGDIILFE